MYRTAGNVVLTGENAQNPFYSESTTHFMKRDLERMVDMVAWKTETSTSTFYTVLIVSEDAEMTSMWETLFKQKDCAVINETLPNDAVQTARLLAPSLIILDLDMPHSERVTLCSALRATTPGALLLLAPKGDEQKIFEYYHAGVDERLSTPIDPLVLLVKSMSWLIRSQWIGPNQANRPHISV
jgi:DNA-binding response OmpR family regulator